MSGSKKLLRQRVDRESMDYNTSFKTFTCISLAAVGYSNRLIREVTGLNDSQIWKRCSYHGVLRTHYRDGTSLVGQHVRKLIGKKLAGVLQKQLLQLEDRK